MVLLALAALLWVGVHVGVAGTRVRGALAARLGEGGFRGVYSLVSVGAIAALVLAWRDAVETGASPPLWSAPAWLGWLLAFAMLPAFVLFAGSVLAPNATAAGGERALAAGLEPRGAMRVTRHPMLWSFAIWSAVHVVGNGDGASALFFGAFGVTALVGMPSIDAKLAARDPAGWAALAARTTLLPSLARVRWREMALPGAVGAVAWAALLYFHPSLFGVSPLPTG